MWEQSAMIRVLLVDDEPDILSLWKRVLAAAEDFTVVEAHRGPEGLAEAIRRTAPQIVVSDFGMYPGDPATAIGALARAHEAVRFVVYSGRAEAAMINAAFDAGVWGYIDKLCKPSEMMAALRRVPAGEVVFPPNFAIDQDL